MDLLCVIRSRIIKNWKAFTYKNKVYCLKHLDTFESEFIQEAKNNKPANTYSFVIEFSLHCFTKKTAGRDGQFSPDLDYLDTREKRTFCFERYELSRQLPSIVGNISKKPCYHTGKGNFFVVHALDEHGNTKDYEVYFKVSRCDKKDKGKLKLFVQSAYVRSDEYKSSQPKKKKIGFFVMAHNIKNDKPIKTPK